MLEAISRQRRRYPINHFRPTDPVSLPRDEFAHYWAQTEWWYYSGRLEDWKGRVYGFELTFFKRITNEDRVPVFGVPAHWFRDVGMVSHFAVTDLERGEFRYKTIHNLFRRSRADSERYHVAINGWYARGGQDAHRLSADMRGVAIALDLTPAKPPTLHGAGGVVERGGGAANCYYSYTNMTVDGTLYVDGAPLPVRGRAWMDHEYGTIRIGRTERGWNWFGIQLEDDSEIMISLILDDRGGISRLYGTYVGADGKQVGLGRDDIVIESKSFWYSAETESTYPSSWDVRLGPLDMRLTIRSLLANQELVTRLIPYWEGIVEVEGARGGHRVTGFGYAELVGYSNKRSFRKYHRWVSNE